MMLDGTEVVTVVGACNAEDDQGGGEDWCQWMRMMLTGRMNRTQLTGRQEQVGRRRVLVKELLALLFSQVCTRHSENSMTHVNW